MSRVRVVLNRRGARELLTSDGGVVSDLRRRARAVAAQAGDGHEVREWRGQNRTRFSVTTVTTEARRAEATDRNLTRALDAARQ